MKTQTCDEINTATSAASPKAFSSIDRHSFFFSSLFSSSHFFISLHLLIHFTSPHFFHFFRFPPGLQAFTALVLPRFPPWIPPPCAPEGGRANWIGGLIYFSLGSQRKTFHQKPSRCQTGCQFNLLSYLLPPRAMTLEKQLCHPEIIGNQILKD